MKRKRHSPGTSRAAARRSAGSKPRRRGGFTAPRALPPAALGRLAAEVVALPSSYGVTSLAVFPIQPYAVHACWEVTPETLEQGRRDLGAEADAVETVLRFHGASDDGAAALPGTSTFEVNVDVRAGDWYVELWSAGQTYVVELGLRTPSGRFQLLARSNRVATPRAEPVPLAASSAENTGREGAPVHDVAGIPARAGRRAHRGQAPGAEHRAPNRPHGGAGLATAAGDLTGESEAAFRAGISSRR